MKPIEVDKWRRGGVESDTVMHSDIVRERGDVKRGREREGCRETWLVRGRERRGHREVLR